MFAIAVTSLATSHQGMIYQNAAWAPPQFFTSWIGCFLSFNNFSIKINHVFRRDIIAMWLVSKVTNVLIRLEVMSANYWLQWKVWWPPHVTVNTGSGLKRRAAPRPPRPRHGWLCLSIMPGVAWVQRGSTETLSYNTFLQLIYPDIPNILQSLCQTVLV